MQAVRINEYGGPEVLQLEEVPQPVPAADEILVKVYASGVNPADWVVREGGMRTFLTLPLTPGWDAAGVVAAVGSDVTSFRAPAPPGQGLRSMQARATAIGGTLRVGPLPTGRWQVLLRVPRPLA